MKRDALFYTSCLYFLYMGYFALIVNFISVVYINACNKSRINNSGIVGDPSVIHIDSLHHQTCGLKVVVCDDVTREVLIINEYGWRGEYWWGSHPTCGLYSGFSPFNFN